MLHRRRHLEARERLLRLQTVRSILVVCHGNICRSPYLEAVLRRELPAVSVSSAGLVGPDRPVPKNSLTVSAERGLDLSTFRSRPLSRVNSRETDLVIVMDPDQGRHLSRMFGVSPKRIFIAGDLDPTSGATRAIHDPWRQSVKVFRASFDRLDRCAATIVKLMPYARGVSPEALISRRSASAQRGRP
jgi:protein-tyrosine phosphatase